MTPRERRRAEVARAWAGIERHRPTSTEPTPIETRCRWCHSPSAHVVRGRAFGLDACEFHAIRAIQAGAVIVGDVDGKRAAALIAKAAVLRVKGGGAMKVQVFPEEWWPVYLIDDDGREIDLDPDFIERHKAAIEEMRACQIVIRIALEHEEPMPRW